MKKTIRKSVTVGLLGLSLFGGVLPFIQSNTVEAATLNKRNNVNGFDKERSNPTEMVKLYAKDMEITFEEALKHFPDGFLYEDRAPGVRYEIYTKTLNTTTWFYRPQLRLYVKEVNGLFSQVYNTSINTHGKIFKGRVYLNLESGRSLYHQVEGHFYETGERTYTSGINLGVGQAGSVSFGSSVSNPAMAYVNFDGHVRK